MKKKLFNFRTIFGYFSILCSVYLIFTTVGYVHSPDFNYRVLLLSLILLVIGIVQIIQRNKPIEKKRFWLLFWSIIVAALAILIVTVVSQKKQIEKLEKIEQSRSGIK